MKKAVKILLIVSLVFSLIGALIYIIGFIGMGKVTVEEFLKNSTDPEMTAETAKAAIAATRSLFLGLMIGELIICAYHIFVLVILKGSYYYSRKILVPILTIIIGLGSLFMLIAGILWLCDRKRLQQ